MRAPLDGTLPEAGKRSPTAPLAALALGAFVIGTAELVVVGMLDLVAADVGISVSTAGQLVTAYAIGIAVGGPLVTAATVRLGRTLVVRLALVLYTLGNLLALIAPSFDLLLVARLATGCIHGLFIGAASIVAASLVLPERRGAAMSAIFGGTTAATVFGVPLGALVADTLDWRVAFAGIVVLSALAVIAAMVVPAVAGEVQQDVSTQARAALAPPVLIVLGAGFVLMCANFMAFTYLTSLLRDVTGVSGTLVSGYLLVYGVACTAGIVLGGRLADRDPAATLLAASGVLVPLYVLLSLVAPSPAAFAVLIVPWGLVGFGLIPALQLRVVTLAGDGADLAATLSASAANGGIAVGALVGGWLVTAFGLDSVLLACAIVSTLALPATWASLASDRARLVAA